MAVGPFARALWRPVGTGFIGQLLEDELYATSIVFESDDFEGRRMQVVHDLANASPVIADVAITTHDFINITDDLPDNSWDSGDFDAVESAFSTMLAALNSKLHTNHTVREQRWYRFGPQINPTAQDPQAPVRVHPVNDAGGSTSAMLPHQMTVSVTERTAVRKRWGRFFMPGFSTDILTQTGSISGTNLDTIADAMHAFYDSCFDAELVPVVWSPTVKRAYSVEVVQVDSIIDVIRSRRPKTPNIRETRP